MDINKAIDQINRAKGGRVVTTTVIVTLLESKAREQLKADLEQIDRVAATHYELGRKHQSRMGWFSLVIAVLALFVACGGAALLRGLL